MGWRSRYAGGQESKNVNTRQARECKAASRRGNTARELDLHGAYTVHLARPSIIILPHAWARHLMNVKVYKQARLLMLVKMLILP